MYGMYYKVADVRHNYVKVKDTYLYLVEYCLINNSYGECSSRSRSKSRIRSKVEASTLSLTSVVIIPLP